MLNDMPVRQIEDLTFGTGTAFVVDHHGGQRRFLPTLDPDDNGNIVEDVGFVSRTINPLNSSRTLTVCSGTRGRGVLGAAQTLTDKRVRESNERYLRENFGDSYTFAIIMRVPVLGGKVITPKFNTSGCVLYQWP